MPFGLPTHLGPMKHALGGSADWRHLLNAIAPSACGGDTANYFTHL